MSFSVSFALITIGAILKFAVTAAVSWISLPATGVVLMAMGLLGLVLSPDGLLGIVWRTDVLRYSGRPANLGREEIPRSITNARY
ncbi:MAG: hypothetical protein ABI662_06530 [Dermatophilaceae bacterium]